MLFSRLKRPASPAPPDEAPPAPLTPPPDYSQFLRAVPPDLLATTRATDLIYGRLGPDDVAAIEEALTEEERSVVATASPGNRKRYLISYAVHHGVRPALLKTGLTPGFPPAEVHAMARGALTIAGSCYYADLVAEALAPGGLTQVAGAAGLDFGCSSGRVVRVLAAAYPGMRWHGCDPIPNSIKWAQVYLPGIDFAVSRAKPPLPYDDASFDLVAAISIWTHFAEAAAVRWLEEMRRTIRPGGHLVLTTHGYHSIAYLADGPRWAAEMLAKARDGLYSRGFWFTPVFGKGGDWGHVDPDWGMAFLTADWLLTQARGGWKVVNFAAGRVESNQDIYTLERC